MKISTLESNAALASVATSRRQFINFAAATAGTAAISVIGLPAFAAPPKSKISTPSISQAGATQISIDIQFCTPLGGTGAPAGFSIQWMTQAEYIANGNQWYLSEDPRLCKASFSGNANGSRYNLLAGECVTVSIGDLLFDNGASTNCPHQLDCGVIYVFRAFAHATNALMRSDFTANLLASPMACTVVPNCSHGFGWWKTHGPDFDAYGVDLNAAGNLWPASVMSGGMFLGNVGYTAAQILMICNKQAQGNGLISLSHQLITAKLNQANGANVDAILTGIATADAFIAGRVVPPIGTGSLSPNSVAGMAATLNSHNEGGTGPGNCTG